MTESKAFYIFALFSWHFASFFWRGGCFIAILDSVIALHSYTGTEMWISWTLGLQSIAQTSTNKQEYRMIHVSQLFNKPAVNSSLIVHMAHQMLTQLHRKSCKSTQQAAIQHCRGLQKRNAMDTESKEGNQEKGCTMQHVTCCPIGRVGQHRAFCIAMPASSPSLFGQRGPIILPRSAMLRRPPSLSLCTPCLNSPRHPTPHPLLRTAITPPPYTMPIPPPPCPGTSNV